MKILFTDDQEYDDENTLENIEIVPVGTYPYNEKILDSIIFNDDIKWIKIVDCHNRKTKFCYPISQIKRIIP